MDMYSMATQVRLKQAEMQQEAENRRLLQQVAPQRPLALKLDVFGWDFTLTVNKHQPQPPRPALTAP
ncbi:MAG: hypothetical protein OHK0046_16460 [Anaerolineae bacterium]